MARVRIDCLDDYLLGADHSERWVLRSDDLDYSRGVLSDTGLKVGRGSRSLAHFHDWEMRHDWAPTRGRCGWSSWAAEKVALGRPFLCYHVS
jgi:hypothetical protein